MEVGLKYQISEVRMDGLSFIQTLLIKKMKWEKKVCITRKGRVKKDPVEWMKWFLVEWIKKKTENNRNEDKGFENRKNIEEQSKYNMLHKEDVNITKIFEKNWKRNQEGKRGF